MSTNSVASFYGPSRLQLIISMIGPSTRVGISDLKSSIRNAILVQVQWDVVFLFDRTTSDYLLICKMDDKYKNMVLDTYTALLLVKNNSIILYSEKKMNWNWVLDRAEV